jgi:hypothetical protein
MPKETKKYPISFVEYANKLISEGLAYGVGGGKTPPGSSTWILLVPKTSDLTNEDTYPTLWSDGVPVTYIKISQPQQQ